MNNTDDTHDHHSKNSVPRRVVFLNCAICKPTVAILIRKHDETSKCLANLLNNLNQ